MVAAEGALGAVVDLGQARHDAVLDPALVPPPEHLEVAFKNMPRLTQGKLRGESES